MKLAAARKRTRLNLKNFQTQVQTHKAASKWKKITKKSAQQKKDCEKLSSWAKNEANETKCFELGCKYNKYLSGYYCETP